jgi:hypothetical protein
MGLLAEAGKVKPQYEAGGLEPGKFKFIEIPLKIFFLFPNKF